MIRWIAYALVGFAGGILGGMGMGGGTILIPALYLIFSLFQREAQGINLITFLPMAVIAVIMHSKNKLIEWNKVFWLAVPASITSLFASYFSGKVSQNVLSVSFGIFLIVLGIFQIVDLLFFKNNKKQTGNNQKIVK